jgi:hypothetical protein
VRNIGSVTAPAGYTVALRIKSDDDKVVNDPIFVFADTHDLPLGALEITSLRWHPLSLLYFASGSAMISKTLKIPKL